MTQSQTLDRPDAQTDDGSGSGDNEVFHYVRKNKILESVVDGGHVVALCGEVFPVTKSAKPGSPICPPCKQIFDRMKRGD